MHKFKKVIDPISGVIDISGLFKQLSSLSVTKPRKNKKPGSLLRDTDSIEPGVETLYKGKWVKVPDNSIVMHKTVGLINIMDPSKYRYPLKKKKEV